MFTDFLASSDGLSRVLLNYHRYLAPFGIHFAFIQIVLCTAGSLLVGLKERWAVRFCAVSSLSISLWINLLLFRLGAPDGLLLALSAYWLGALLWTYEVPRLGVVFTTLGLAILGIALAPFRHPADRYFWDASIQASWKSRKSGLYVFIGPTCTPCYSYLAKANFPRKLPTSILFYNQSTSETDRTALIWFITAQRYDRLKEYASELSSIKIKTPEAFAESAKKIHLNSPLPVGKIAKQANEEQNLAAELVIPSVPFAILVHDGKAIAIPSSILETLF